jgi:Matrixin
VSFISPTSTLSLPPESPPQEEEHDEISPQHVDIARLLVTVLFAAALFLPASSDAHGLHAHHRHVSATPRRHMSVGKLATRDPVILASAVAERFWGAVPCHGQLAVLINRPLVAGLDQTTDGWVMFDSSLGQNNLAAPASTYTQCTISLARWQWPTRTSIENDWNMFCLTVIHEMGHLLGHPHSSTAGSVMAPVFTNESNVPVICRAPRSQDAKLAGRQMAR